MARSLKNHSMSRQWGGQRMLSGCQGEGTEREDMEGCKHKACLVALEQEGHEETQQNELVTVSQEGP